MKKSKLETSRRSWQEATRAAFGPNKPKARRFWKGAFPDLVEFRLCNGDIEAARPLDRQVAPYAYLRIERASSSAAYMRMNEIARGLLGKSTWGHGIEHSNRGGYFTFLWPTSKVSVPPIGLATFSISVDIDPSVLDEGEALDISTPIPEVGFEFHLAFVKSSFRRKGFGLYLGAGVSSWLNDCKVTPPRCTKKGIEVYYHADFYSGGGQVISDLVTQSFQVLQERFLSKETHLPWYIRKFHEDAGY